MIKSRLAKTVAAHIPVVLAGIITSFLYTPYLLSKIGAEAYAFYPLSFNIINYASVFTVLFTSMLSKFITVDYHSGNYLRMNKFFNSSIRGNVIIGAAVGIPMLVGSLFIDRIIDVPAKLAFEVKVLFMTVTAAFFVIQLRNTFIVANIATEKRYLTTLQKAFEKVMIVAVPVVLFVFVKPSVMYLGVSVLIAVSLRLLITVKTQRKIMPQLEVSGKYVEREVAGTLILSGLWHAFNQLIILLNTNVEILLSNLIFGSEVQSEYTLAFILPNLIRTMIIYGNNWFLPFLALLFKDESYEELKKSIPKFIKCMSVAMAVIVSLITGLGDVLLDVWIGGFDSFEMYILMILSALSVFVTGSFSIIYSILVVHDKMKLPAIIMFTLGILNIPLSVILSDLFGIYGILISSLTVNILGYTFFIPYYCSRTVRFKIKKLYPAFLGGVYVLSAGTVFGILIKLLFKIDSFSKLILAVVSVIILLVPVIFKWLLSKEDILFITDIIKAKIEYGNDANELGERDFDGLG